MRSQAGVNIQDELFWFKCYGTVWKHILHPMDEAQSSENAKDDVSGLMDGGWLWEVTALLIHGDFASA